MFFRNKLIFWIFEYIFFFPTHQLKFLRQFTQKHCYNGLALPLTSAKTAEELLLRKQKKLVGIIRRN